MQNRHQAHLTTDIMGISSQLDDRFGSRLDEQAVEILLIHAHKSTELMRQRKDNVIIRYRQEFLLSALEPCFSIILVTFRTTAVTTGVIRILKLATVITFKYMATHGRCTASEYILECSSMTGRHSFAELLQILCAVTSEDIGHFDHGVQSRLMSLLIFV